MGSVVEHGAQGQRHEPRNRRVHAMTGFEQANELTQQREVDMP
jgi:hypothetical protein